MKNIVIKLLEFFSKPSTTLAFILIVLLCYFLSEGFRTGFGNNLLSFGPTKDSNGEPSKFIGIYLNSWTNVSLVYIITFISTLLQTYYGWVVSNNRYIASYVLNPADNVIPKNTLWSYLILTPFLYTLLYVISFFATATLQMQYIIPQFLAYFIANLPFTISWLHKKTFVK